jgi:hypothetical protein
MRSSRPPAWDREDAVIKWIGDLFAAREATSTHVVLYPVDLLAGTPKREPGRPKMTEGARRAANPIHDAADKVIVIERLLRENYPGQNIGIRDRAVKIAAQRFSIEVARLRNYIRRSKRDRSRISAPN